MEKGTVEVFDIGTIKRRIVELLREGNFVAMEGRYLDSFRFRKKGFVSCLIQNIPFCPIADINIVILEPPKSIYFALYGSSHYPKIKEIADKLAKEGYEVKIEKY